MVGKSLPNKTLPSRSASRVSSGSGYGAAESKKSVNIIVVSRYVRSYRSARSRNSAYSGAPMCATTAVSIGCRSSTRRSGSGPVNPLPTGPEPAWMTTGVPASAIVPQTSSSARSSRWNSPTCTCTLNTSTPAATRSATYDAASGSG